jgi:hypothetical protein
MDERSKIMGFMGFWARGVGRVVRIVAGVALVGVGIFLLLAGSNVAGVMVGVVGLVPLLTGLFDVWVCALLFGAPFLGVQIRQRVQIV